MRSLIAALLLVPALAAAEQPRDFAYGIPLQTSGQDPLQQLALPRAVYEGVVHADLADLRVFNGAGEVVAHAFRPQATTTTEKPRPLPVTLFAIRTDEPPRVLPPRDGVSNGAAIGRSSTCARARAGRRAARSWSATSPTCARSTSPFEGSRSSCQPASIRSSHA